MRDACIGANIDVQFYGATLLTEMERSGIEVAAHVHITNGGLAQLGEHHPCKQGVESSNLLVSTCKLKSLHDTKEWRPVD